MAAGKRASMSVMPPPAGSAAIVDEASARAATRAMAAVSLFAAAGHLGIELVSNFLPIVYPILVAEAGFSFAQVGTVTLVATLGITLPQPLLGLVVRRFAAGRLVLIAVVWCGLFYGAVGLVPRFWPLLVWVALGGLGSALFHPAGSVVASVAHSRRRGASMSIFSVGGNVGAALSPLLMAAVIGWQGLRGTLVTVPLALVMAALLWLIPGRGATPDRVERPGRRRADPQPVPNSAARVPPRSDAGAVAGKSPHLAEAGRSAPAAGARAAGVALGLIVLFAMARAWYQVSLTTYFPLWIDSHDGARTGLAQVLFVLVGSLPAGSLLGGALSDRVGRWQVVLAAAALLVPVNGALLAVGPGGAPAAVLPLTAAIGCLIGMTYPVAIIMAQEAWPRNIGLAGGLVMGLGWLPGGVGASALGLLADSAGLQRALSTLVVPLLVGVAAIGAYAAIRIRGKRAPGTPWCDDPCRQAAFESSGPSRK